MMGRGGRNGAARLLLTVPTHRLHYDDRRLSLGDSGLRVGLHNLTCSREYPLTVRLSSRP